jgi:hypothetical protein
VIAGNGAIPGAGVGTVGDANAGSGRVDIDVDGVGGVGVGGVDVGSMGVGCVGGGDVGALTAGLSGAGGVLVAEGTGMLTAGGTLGSGLVTRP